VWSFRSLVAKFPPPGRDIQVKALIKQVAQHVGATRHAGENIDFKTSVVVVIVNKESFVDDEDDD
jgi:hypothetical protein